MNDTQPHAQAVIGVSGFRVESAGMGVSGERFIRIDLPSTFTEEHVIRMQRDLEHVAQLAQQYPKDMVELGNAAARHDFHIAGEVARRIGLTEAEFVTRGGGQVGIAIGIVAVLVVAALILADGPTGEPGPPPTPAAPTTDLDGGLPPGGAP
jgi:hypothetical protein